MAERELHIRNVDALNKLMRELPITVSTRWKAAHKLVIECSEWQRNEKLQRAEKLDILKVFDAYSVEIAKAHEEQVRRNRIERHRRARKARDAFRTLLSEMESAGKITARTAWKEVLPLLENRPEYDALLGMPGSGPLDLFQDTVDDIGEAVGASSDKIRNAVDKAGKKIDASTTKEQFQSLLQEHKITSFVDERYVDQVYELVSNSR
jgi:pre-mRNA-processing factor 40